MHDARMLYVSYQGYATIFYYLEKDYPEMAHLDFPTLYRLHRKGDVEATERLRNKLNLSSKAADFVAWADDPSLFQLVPPSPIFDKAFKRKSVKVLRWLGQTYGLDKLYRAWKKARRDHPDVTHPDVNYLLKVLIGDSNHRLQPDDYLLSRILGDLCTHGVSEVIVAILLKGCQDREKVLSDTGKLLVPEEAETWATMLRSKDWTTMKRMTKEQRRRLGYLIRLTKA